MKRRNKSSPPINRDHHCAAFVHARTVLKSRMTHGRLTSRKGKRLHYGSQFTAELMAEAGPVVDITIRLDRGLRIHSKAMSFLQEIKVDHRREISPRLRAYLDAVHQWQPMIQLDFRSLALLTAALSFDPALTQGSSSDSPLH